MRRDDCTVIDAHGQSLSLPPEMILGTAASVHTDPEGRVSIVAAPPSE